MIFITIGRDGKKEKIQVVNVINGIPILRFNELETSLASFVSKTPGIEVKDSEIERVVKLFSNRK